MMEVSWFDFTSFREARSARIPRLGKYHQTSHTLITEKEAVHSKKLFCTEKEVFSELSADLFWLFSQPKMCVCVIR